MRSEAENAGAELLSLRGVELGYGGQRVLSGVDLSVRAGQYWFVLGPNGSGKTTLLRALLGLIQPVAGEVRRGPGAAREAMGYVPQHCELSRALPTSVREFVSLGSVGIERERAEREADLEWAMEQVGLSGLARHDYWSLSGGQRKRTHVARALARRPGLLLLDEATEGMDAGSQEAFLETLDELRGDGLSAVFVTHRLDIAAHHATHVALVHAGRVASGPRDEILALPAIEDAFGCAAPLLRGDGALP